jgi:hypothetical protein
MKVILKPRKDCLIYSETAETNKMLKEYLKKREVRNSRMEATA